MYTGRKKLQQPMFAGDLPICADENPPRKGCVKNLSELIKYLDVRDLRIVTGP